MNLIAQDMDYRALNAAIRAHAGDVCIDGCLGQRYIGAGVSHKTIVVRGTAGNALGAYLDGGRIVVYGNAQDAVADTMNEGRIVIHGSVGDTAGYAMRGGELYVKGDAGYRAGVHMKAYQKKSPVIVIGGKCGSFLGEYQAGGTIIVLGINVPDKDVIGYFCGTGMHGGRIFIRAGALHRPLPEQVHVERAGEDDVRSIEPYLKKYVSLFGNPVPDDDGKAFFMITPNSSNPYRQLYVQN